MPPVILGIIVNSALYLSGCFIAGIVLNNRWAWSFALLATGLTYISYSLQFHSHPLAVPITWSSIVAGVMAGAVLVFKV